MSSRVRVVFPQGVLGYTCDTVAIPKDKTHVCKQHVVRSPDGTVA